MGDTVKKGQTIIILEAMKMENNINADKDGKITAINVSKGAVSYTHLKSFLIEFRNLENPLFGYKAFRKNNYFAINWLR